MMTEKRPHGGVAGRIFADHKKAWTAQLSLEERLALDLVRAWAARLGRRSTSQRKNPSLRYLVCCWGCQQWLSPWRRPSGCSCWRGRCTPSPWSCATPKGLLREGEVSARAPSHKRDSARRDAREADYPKINPILVERARHPPERRHDHQVKHACEQLHEPISEVLHGP
jgi:hypothetical protein